MPPPQRICVVANPVAGGGRARALLPRVLALLGDVSVRVTQTDRWQQAIAATRAGRAADALVVIGGDGMAHLGLNACAGSATPVAIVPAGTGNDIVRGLGARPRLADPLRAVGALLAGDVRSIDMIDTGVRVDQVAPGGRGDSPTGPDPGAQRYLGSVCCTGFDAVVNLRANAMRRPRGSLRYTIATLLELPSFAPLPYTLTLDGESREVEAMLVAVGNTAYYGGGMRICPDADPADGLLDVTIIHSASRALLLRLLPSVRTGAFASHRVVEQLRVGRIALDGQRTSRSGSTRGPLTAMGDGEIIGPLPRTLIAAAGAVQVAT